MTASPLLLLLALLALLAGAVPPAGAQARPKKLIASGWDSPTTAQFRRDLAVMEALPLDGATIWVQARGPDLPENLNRTPFRQAFSRIPWKREWFRHAIDDLKAVRGAKSRLTDNFLMLSANPGDVDWFDDPGWKEIVDHFRIAAWIAREGGLKGIAFDPEPYTKPFVPFDYKAQARADRHTFEEYLKKARERGREVMRAIAREYPDITLLTFFMNAYLVASNPHHGPTASGLEDPRRALFLHSYGLYPAFIDGWLDRLPRTATLVDGNEHGYFYTSEDQFHVAAARIKGAGQELVSPANRPRYRRQVEVGFGIYLDAHHPPFKSRWELPGAGLDLLERNVAAALSASDRYVWLWGEQGQWWPDPKALREWPTKRLYPPWTRLMPGIAPALAAARDPAAAAEQRAHAEYQAQRETGIPLLRNGDFSQGPVAAAAPGASPDWGEVGAPAGWQYWQSEFSRGRFDWDEELKAARAAGVRSGVFLQTLPARPGDRFYVTFKSRTRGKGAATLTLAWKRADGSWLPEETRKRVFLPRREAERGAWEEWGTFGVAPPEAGLLVVMLGVAGQPTPRDVIWFDDAAAVKLPRAPGTDP